MTGLFFAKKIYDFLWNCPAFAFLISLEFILYLSLYHLWTKVWLIREIHKTDHVHQTENEIKMSL